MDQDLNTTGGGSTAETGAPPARDTLMAIAFRAGHHRMVTAASDVERIIPCGALTRIPGAAEWLIGATSHRGAVLPVADLGRLLWDEPTRFSSTNRLLVPTVTEMSVALLVDEVFPEQPVRQWVLSVPYPLRFLFASRPAIMGRVLGIVYGRDSMPRGRSAGRPY